MRSKNKDRAIYSLTQTEWFQDTVVKVADQRN